MVAIAVILMGVALRPGRVDLDPAPRAAVAKTVTVAVESTSPVSPVPERKAEVPVSKETPVKVRSTALEVLDSKVPYATARAVNSWFDFESAVSDLSGSREVLGEETYRQELLRMTAEFLELAPERVPAFDSTLRIVQADFRKIQRDMGRLLASAPVDLSDAELRRLQSDAERRFQPGREVALARFDSFLDDARDRHREFRNYLERWVTRCCGLEP
jgi:hypothetical protein